MALDHIAWRKLFDARFLGLFSDLLLLSIWPDDIVAARIDYSAILDKCLEIVHVPGRHPFWDGENQGNVFRHADFIELKIRVWADDCTRREVGTLSRKVMPDPALFAL